MPAAASSLSDIVKAYDVRGIVPDQLDDRVAFALGDAFARVVALPEGAERVVVGHDMRASSPALAAAFAHGVAGAGVDVSAVGLSSTDQLYFASGRFGQPGAVITASHNPAAYNGIKLCRAGAAPVGEQTGLAQIRDLAQERLDRADADPRSTATAAGRIERRDTLSDYGAFLRGLVDLRGIRPLRVVVDAANGMAGHTVPAVLGTSAGLPDLPLDIVPLYFELDGTFPNHEANPLDPKNLRDLQAAVPSEGADLGLAFDGDADRCFVVDERGEPVSASAITALVADRLLARERAAGATPASQHVVHNVITSLAVPELVRARGAVPVRSRVGHSFMKAEMARTGAVFGGEHSAHYYFRDFWFADTGLLAAMHVLAAVGTSAEPLSQLAAQYQTYVASGEINSTVPDAATATERAVAWARAQGPVDVDDLDGLTVRHPGEPTWWFNLRTSNTEPLLRLNVEARDEHTTRSVTQAVLAAVREG